MRPTRCVVVLFAVLIACPLLAAYPNVERAPAGDKSPGSKYVIEPPEVLQIEMLKLVPLPPDRAESFDVLQLHVSGTLPDQPIDNYYIAEADGTINLGPAYGTVRVAGLALDEIKRTVEKKLREVLKAPVVSVQLACAFRAARHWSILGGGRWHGQSASLRFGEGGRQDGHRGAAGDRKTPCRVPRLTASFGYQGAYFESHDADGASFRQQGDNGFDGSRLTIRPGV